MSHIVKLTVSGGQEQSIDLAPTLSDADKQKAAQLELCQYWPDARTFLQLLEQIVPKLKPIIDAIIAIGNQLCP